MALDAEHLAATSARLLPDVVSWLRELRCTDGGADPVALLKSLYDGSGPDGVRARVRLGGIESLTALGPGEFNTIVDQARRYL